MTTFDPRPLTEPVDRRAMREWARAEGVPAFSLSKRSGGTLLVFLVVGILVVVGFGTIGTVFSSAISLIAKSGAWWAFLFYAMFALVAVTAAGGAVSTIMMGFSRRTRAYRLSRFARANGLSYEYEVTKPALPGMIFGHGKDRAATDLLRGTTPRFVEFGNYQYTTKSGDDETTHRWGYVAIKLDVPLPHMVLDATSNNSLLGSNLPISLSRSQRLKLEGDFNTHFDLYCPSGYERDALYLFTPDIMARFIDNAAALDVEIIDDWVFFYSKREFSTLDPATWAWLFATVRALLDKLAQWSRWRDDRLQAEHAAQDARGATSAVPGNAPAVSSAAQGAAGEIPVDAARMMMTPPGVASGGRRLRGGMAWGSIVVVVLFAIPWILHMTGMFSQMFGN